MSKLILTITSVVFLTSTLSALNMDEANTIIEEVSEVTKGLQDSFDKLTQEETQESNVTKSEEQTVVTPQEIIEVTEINTSIPTNNELNGTTKQNITPINEENITIEVKPHIEAEENSSIVEPTVTDIEQNSTSVTKSTQTTIIDSNSSKEEENLTRDEHYETEGSATRGLIIFKTHLKKVCGMTGEEFAKNYTQEDWDDIYDAKEFKKVVIELCPKVEGHYKERWTPHLYQFSLKYASDSDEIPEC